ncbi:hypothetical protein [Microbacterium sp. Root166]|uniref:hypothetical protein n=1 Tax=Microbacterium sp. Root166 TaxID=1736478 RepID=UPI0012FC3713|nr:hypothetical protein [Microbacterium sp. Root166]
MAELSCRLSPLVYNVLYRRLADDADAHAALEPRLAEIELDLEWLDSAAEAYGRKWSSNVELLNTGVPADEIQRLEAPHALLASWILTALRRRGSSDDFSAAMRSEILAHLDTDEQDVSELGGREEFSPVIVGWTFGMVVQNDIDLNLPAIPATPIKNKHIAAAYEGLVRHVAALRLEAEPWPDLVGTSTLVRGVGLAEALRPEEGSARAAIKALLRESARYVPSPVQTTLANHWDRGDIIGKRNAVVHIMPTSSGGLPFLDVMNPADNWGKIKPTIQGITQFIFQEVARELADEASEVHRGIWDQRLKWDVEVW